MTRSEVLERAEFDPKLRVYLVLQGGLGLVATVVGVVLVPVWLLAGPWWARRYFQRLECLLTGRSLVYKKGIVFRSETTIPLDKIQDLSVRYGPVLDMLGLAKLKVVTAGQHANQGATIGLVGVVDAPDFRDRVLERRDVLTESRHGPRALRSPEGVGAAVAGSREAPSESEADVPDPAVTLAKISSLLEEIRDLLGETRSEEQP